MSLDSKGSSEIIRMVIIVSFIAVIYMTAIYIWQFIETHKRVTYVVEQLNKILEESIQTRKDSINFDFNSQGGCANANVYSFNRERTASLAVFADIKKLELANKKKIFFDVGTEGLDLKMYRGDFVGYLHCTDKLDPSILEYETFEASSGEIGVMLENYNFVDKYIEDVDYQVTIFLKDIIFLDDSGDEIYIGKYIFDAIDVGWMPN